MARPGPVDRQLEAYNAHDIDAFVACYSPEVVVVDGAGNRLMSGGSEMREEYAPFFAANPGLRGEIVHRIEVGDWVIDEERIHGWQDAPVRAVAAYRVAGDLIDRVQFFEGS
jgi:hypothetical protein